jgi:predicted dehydrogenase
VHATGLSRIANPMRSDDRGSFTSDTDDGAFVLVDYGHGLVGRLSVDATTGVEQTTVAVHGEKRTAVASGTDFVDLRLFAIDEDEQSELECKPSPYAKFESLGGNVPLLCELYDEWVKQIESGASDLPTFDEAVETQRVLAAAGYATGG